MGSFVFAFINLFQFLLDIQVVLQRKTWGGEILRFPSLSFMEKQTYDPHLDFPVEYRNPSVGIWIDSGFFAFLYFSHSQKIKILLSSNLDFFFLYINSGVRLHFRKVT